ncbi:hypothetical protein OAI20_04650, partial [Gammaproteobacteria bacterium]|nr:hypothetical protein [Gammaproteobacteria bacterium]
IVYWPALIDSIHIKEKVYVDGKKIEVLPTSQLGLEDKYYQKEPIDIPEAPKSSRKCIKISRRSGQP